MENIKNTSEDNGKIVIRISNKLAFAYIWQSDYNFIDSDINNYRYATKEEQSIYNENKSPDDRFYSLINAPQLRHEILKERIDALHEVYKHISSDTMYKLITCDMSRKYWQHELNESKDKEIEALKKQVSSLIQYKDSLTKDLLNSIKWISLEKQKPLATESGSWDGLRSDPILVQDKKGVCYVATMYEGSIDGSYFCDFYTLTDAEREIENVINWKHIN